MHAAPDSQWLALTTHGRLVRLNLDRGTATPVVDVPAATLDLQRPVELHLSPDGRFVAAVNSKGRYGEVIDLATGAATMSLDRGEYHEDVCRFSVAFFVSNNTPLLVHATSWNRLDISDPATGTLLTRRAPTQYRQGEQQPEHYLDYFHCGLSVSPDRQWVVDNGWVWHPWGMVRSWNLLRWRDGNVWESEDGPSQKTLCDRMYLWDAPLCWLDATTLAIWGEGRDDEQMIPAVVVYDVRSGARLRWFAGPDVAPHADWPIGAARAGWLVFDRWLFAISPQHGTGVWDADTGERLHHDPDCAPSRYHRGTRQFLTLQDSGSVRLSTLLEGPA